MPDGPNRPADSTVLLLPGASLMEIRLLALNRLLIRCPGCNAIKVVSTRPAVTASHEVFVHEFDDCHVLVQIEAALAVAESAMWTTAKRK